MGNINIKVIGCWLPVFFVLALTPTTQATLYTLADDNSTAIINDAAVRIGMTGWTIDGTNHIYHHG